ncbi:non-ribosomal peptide synthetase [Pseudomonas tohonis]|uniref:non-ribosomal peptide synthetase n=1 Tax=Pseudomonas tohonis TaxID=2725477 RepID=UPI0023EEF6B5|nr:non-ribosomal peptide synthetase [Pseudomonas tohonis]
MNQPDNLSLVQRFIRLPLAQRQAFLDKLRSKNMSFSALPIPVTRHEFPSLELSYAQERQWFLWRLDPDSAAYNMPTALRLRGALDIEALQRSVDGLLERHEVLRTVFVEDGQGLRQVVVEAGRLAIEFQALEGAVDEGAIKAFVDDEVARPFDLQRGPLVRLKLLRLAQDDHVLVLTLHHIVSDGASSQVMVEDLIELYLAHASGRAAALAPLPIQYADYAIWQRKWMEAGEQQRQLAYWTERLGDAGSVLSLPADRARPLVQSHRGARLDLQLETALASALRELAQRQGLTLFMVLLASFQALLHRYSGQADIRVGVPIANRNRVETERLIGFFVNTQVLDADIRGDMPFTDLLAQVKQAALGAQAHQDLPFEQVVQALAPERQLSHGPLFQVMFNHQSDGAGQALQLPGLRVESLDWSAHTAQFDLTLDTLEAAGELTASLTYATDLFDAGTVSRLAGHWLNLLRGIVADPQCRVGELPLLDAEERQANLRQWNPAARDFDVTQCAHQRIAEQARLRPEAIALRFEAQTLSYGELDTWANRLAHQLIERGVGPDVRVGLATERGLEMVVGLLAILKAGGAYVPLDPSYPEDRLAYMIEDSGIRLLLTQPALLQSLPIPAKVEALLLEGAAGYPEHEPQVAMSPANLAYVIYTSGSTGKPKGTLLPHSNLMRLFQATEGWFDFGPRDVWSLFHSYAFDFSVWEIFGALLYGGELVIVPHDVSRSPQDFHALLVSTGVTVLNQTPSAFKPLMQIACAAQDELALRYVVFGGEALDVHGLRPWFERFGDTAPQLINMYGITETTVHVTYRPLSLADLEHDASSPIGEPIPDLSWYLLDGELNPVPRGCIGELYVGRAGLARGYLNRGDLTAQRFIPDPFGEPGARLYRTGDLAQYRSDGVIQYVGRIDHQVKIRGFRIELGEIEARLAALDAVREAVVLAHEGPTGTQLVGYVLPASPLEDAGALRDALKTGLKAELPDYMVPTHLLFVERWPLTANGKLDRKALPQPDASQAQQHHVAPQSELEQRLALIWQDVLKLERVGLNDNFFELGGHSLLATQMVSRIRQELGLDLQLRQLFENADFKACVKVLEQSAGVQTLSIPRVDRGQSLPLSYAQQRQWFLWQMEPGSAAYHIPAALRIEGELDIEALQRAFAGLVQRHESLRTTFVQSDGQARQLIHPDLPLVLSPEVEEGADEAYIRAFVQKQVSEPFDLEKGPLLRVGLLRIAPQAHVLVLTQHHIVSDGWSMQLLVQELMEGYGAHGQGLAVRQDALPIQYADYAAWQRQWMEAGERERQLAYWTAALGDEHPLLELPTDRPRPAQQSFAGARLAIELPPALAGQLAQLAQREGVTLFMVLLASFQALLHRYSGQADIRVGVPIANRNRVETERLIGFFVNTQVLRAQVDGQVRFADLLGQARDAALGAEAHQDLPFEQLVDALRPERSLSHSPLFQVLYNHQSAGREALPSLPGLTLKAQDWDSHTAQFDLTLDTLEAAGELTASLTYATDLFDADTVSRLAGHWLNLLRGIVADPQCRVGELPLLDAEERQANLQQWNPAARAFDVTQCAHQRIAEQARLRPAAIALRFEAQTLSYGELDTWANRLAHQLIERGVGLDVRVGLATERGLEMVVGLLAILKAGGAYVPLDPSYPEDRLAYMIEDSGIRLLLTQPALLQSLPIPAKVEALMLEGAAGYPEHEPQVAMSPANLAYVIYTSGSTGKPKGTLLPHSNIMRLFQATEGWFDFGAQDVWSLFHSYAFDFSVWEIFGALLYGGELVIVPHDVSRSPQDFHALLVSTGVTVLNQTPSAFKPLMQMACAAQDELALRYVVFGGEALDVHGLRPWFERFGDSAPQLINMYGITETTVHVTYRPLSLADLEHDASSPIGEPIPDLSWYLLDGDLNPVPRGCIGELYVGRAGLARGYLNRGDLTAQRFIPDPFGEPGARLYRTGDLAQYRSDGVIQYVGRIDHQVKIRGFRIELGEIEARLAALDAVREAVVLAHEGPTGTQLVGYVLPASPLEDAGALRDALKTELKAELPDYMVPTHLLFVEHWPLTANGKLDRKALPQPDASQAQQHYVAPQSELEQRLALIWQDVLKLERVGLNDNFFELGGDSIISIQVVSRARQDGIRITPKDLFQHQTVHALAGVAQVGDEAFAVDQGPVLGSTPLLPIQQAFFAEPIPERHHYNQSVLLAPASPLQPGVLEQALRSLVRHHDALRLSFVEGVEGWEATHRDLDRQEQDWAHASLLWEARVADAAALDTLLERAQRSLDLQDGPLLRAVLATLADGTQRLQLVVHHLAIDGVSWRILFDDLQAAYRQVQGGEPVRLPSKTSSVKAFAEQMQRHARSETLQRQLGFWQEHLQDACAELPCERPDAPREARLAHTLFTQLGREATRRLLQEAPKAYRTQVNDLLLTALARVICRWTGQPNTLIQLEGHGREELFPSIDLTRTLGWFTSLFPVKLTPADALAASIKAVKEQLRAIPDKGTGFGALRYLGDECARAALRALPEPRLTFNYLGQFDGSFDDSQAALFRPAREGSGADHSPLAPLGNWLSLNGQVYDGELSLGWTFSREQFDEQTIQRLADDYAAELEQLIEHCAQPINQGVTPSDFPLAGLGQGQLDALPVSAREVDDLYPLTPMQQGMLFHSLYEPGTGHYINQMRLDMQGLDPERFQRAWQEAVEAHDILRSRFIWEGGLERPLQVVQRQVEVPFARHDWRGRDDLATALDALATAELEQGFDLARAPLLRLALVQVGEGAWHLVYTHHHILMDGWSNSQLLGEVLQRYAGQQVVRQGGRYRDYIAWLAGRDPVASETFWRGQLAALDAPTRLAGPDQPRASRADEPSHDSFHRSLSREECQRLGEFARQQKVTLNTLVQAAWLLLLQRHTGQDGVAFGATVAGRPAELRGIQEQIGLFINTLPVIASPRPEQPLVDLLQALQAQNLALREHEHTPLYDIQRWAGQGGDSLFDTLLVFENYPVSQALQDSAPDGLGFGALGNREQTNFPLTLAVHLSDILNLHFTYANACYSRESIQGLGDQMVHLLMQMPGSNAQRRLGEFGLLDAPMHARVVEQWNATETAPRDARQVHQWVAFQAQRQPQAVAVLAEGQSLTYGQLNAQANRLAHLLIERGVGPDVLVGLALQRGPLMVVGLLAILKAGGAYVPLDPAYPQDRLAYMVEDSGIALLLSERALEARFVDSGVSCLALDGLDEVLASRDERDPAVSPDGQNLAYVIYTSGSTGRPKGVGIRHSALSNHMAWMQDRLALQAEDRVLQKTAISFDASVWEFWLPLMSGAQLVLASPDLNLDLTRLWAEVVRWRISVLQLAPSLLQALLPLARREQLATLRLLLCGGEALGQHLADQAMALFDGELHNLYGPTEATIDSTSHLVAAAEGDERRTVAIGRPLGNVRTYVLDCALQPCAIGAVGELYIAGDSLARGYHQRPALTAERFIPDPFARSGREGGRLYRTGDLVRYTADGVIEYIGRIDHQVKVRGLRIELGEIEARLRAQPEVREAVVLAPDGQALVAYVVAEAGALEPAEALLGERLKARLADHLPDFMVPGQVVFLDRLPLTTNGKLDRKALPAPDARPLQVAYVAPGSELELQVAAIWQDVLKLDQVGLGDDFFELGGHSLLAVNVVSRLQLELGMSLTPQLIFQHPVLGDFVAQLQQTGAPTSTSTLSRLEALLDEMEEV